VQTEALVSLMNSAVEMVGALQMGVCAAQLVVEHVTRARCVQGMGNVHLLLQQQELLYVSGFCIQFLPHL
jgi:hypothetical protein